MKIGNLLRYSTRRHINRGARRGRAQLQLRLRAPNVTTYCSSVGSGGVRSAKPRGGRGTRRNDIENRREPAAAPLDRERSRDRDGNSGRTLSYEFNELGGGAPNWRMRSADSGERDSDGNRRDGARDQQRRGMRCVCILLAAIVGIAGGRRALSSPLVVALRRPASGAGRRGRAVGGTPDGMQRCPIGSLSRASAGLGATADRSLHDRDRASSS